MREDLLEGVGDLVPGYSSLLVLFDNRRLQEPVLLNWLNSAIEADLLADSPGLNQSKHHVVPVQYGGDSGMDLDDLAVQLGVEPHDIVRAHTRRPFQIAFIGFLPGFAYMARFPRRRPIPRLQTPRTRVPAGSVGIAGFQTGIYPFSSPGGWRIIGRTGLKVWDHGSPNPARLAPGDTVQFVESRYEPPPQEPPSIIPTPTLPALEVVQTGGMGLIQDLGRSGFMHLGVGQNGAFDLGAAQRANLLVGNEPSSAVLELALGGPTLRVLRNLTIAIDGADFQCRADTVLIPPRLSWFVRAGTILRFNSGTSKPPLTANHGYRSYLAVSGGFDVPLVLGSRSTSLLARFGGQAGRPVQSRDVLGIIDPRGNSGSMAGHYWLGHTSDISHKPNQIRFTTYTGPQAAQPTAQHTFIEHAWEVAPQSDRMGLRLKSSQGIRLATTTRELASFGVVPGTIQLPHAGEPLILGPDCQTTGGYPILGVVVRADMPLIAQASPGVSLEFVPVTLDDARAATESYYAEIGRGAQTLSG